jgi:hypothetical protein
MFSFNWFLELVPQWVPWAIIVTGVALFVLVHLTWFLPLMYRLPIKIAGMVLSMVLFGSGFYLEGRQGVLVNAKKEIDKAVSDQKTVTKKVTDDLTNKLKETKSNNEKIIQYINTKDDNVCSLPSSFVSVLNYAAKDTVPNPTGGTNGSSTGPANTTGR